LSKLRRPLNVIHGNDRFIKFNRARGNSIFVPFRTPSFPSKIKCCIDRLRPPGQKAKYSLRADVFRCYPTTDIPQVGACVMVFWHTGQVAAVSEI